MSTQAHPLLPLDKPALRARIRATRRRVLAPMSGAARRVFDERATRALTRQYDRLFPACPPTAVAAYWPLPFEPNPVPWLQTLLENRILVYLPVCGPERSLSFARWDHSIPLSESRSEPNLKLWEPAGETVPVQELGDVGLFIVPALGASRNGARLGQGAGYYDRFLAQLRQHNPQAHVASLIHPWEMLEEDSAWVEAHDMRSDSVVR